ncbi:MAG: M23 family metallopeptidase [Anaeromyxobacteraceae bacterium]
MTSLALTLLAAATATATAAAHAPSVEVRPPRARPGEAVLVVVRGAAAPPAASVAGRDLGFFQVRGGFAAVAGLPVETAAGPLDIAATVTPRGGGAAQQARATLEVVAPVFPHRDLEVAKRFVEPPAPEVQQRIDADRAAFAQAFSRPAAPPLFAKGFALPRRAPITAHFGEERTMNETKRSQHYGTDLAGRVGDPVVAANDGEVALVRDCWASGLSVVVSHGAGTYTTYFHLSRAAVREGERVRRGQRLGLVGRSGRVTGPHLHWGVKVGDLYVDPESVVRLPFTALLGGGAKAVRR